MRELMKHSKTGAGRKRLTLGKITEMIHFVV